METSGVSNGPADILPTEAVCRVSIGAGKAGCRSRQVARIGPTQLGLLFSAVGAGTVVGALVIASLGDFAHKGPLVLGSILLWAVVLALFGTSSSLQMSIPLLFILGAAQNSAGATTTTLLQTRVPPEMRGRAMSLNTLLVM